MSYDLEQLGWELLRPQFWRLSIGIWHLKRDYEKFIEMEIAKRSLQVHRPALVKPVESCGKFNDNPDLYIQCLYVLYHAGGDKA